MDRVVVDAPFLIEGLLEAQTFTVLERLLVERIELHILHLTDLEFASTMRKVAGAGTVSEEEARQRLDDYVLLPLHRHVHTPLLPRVFDLRHNFSAYDAAYVALAEAIDATIVTRDQRLRRALERHAPQLVSQIVD